MLQLMMPIKRIGATEVLTMSISESNPFLSASRSEEPSISSDSFPGGGAWNQKNKKIRQKKVRKRRQKITKHQAAIAAKIVAFTLCPQNSARPIQPHTRRQESIYPP
jgi:hypothetical protein